jgi:Flp pilus assembly protein TadD
MTGRLGWLIAIVAACAHPPAPKGPSAIVRADLDRAESAETARKHDVARAEYERAIADAHDPDSIAIARFDFAETLATWGESEAAVTQLEAVLVAKPDHAAAWHDLGMLRYHLEEYDVALRALRRSKQLAPDDPRPRRDLAVMLWARGDRAGALAEYRELARFDLPRCLGRAVRWAIAELEGRHPPALERCT